jgi:glycine/D-amino acid oxidase-like deaminating enzyme
MTSRQAPEFDVAVIGAGFFGCQIALALRELGVERVALLEREPAIMQRASYVNQARVHNGYHYPRALLTAERSRVSFERFVHDFDYAIAWGIEKVYAIAQGSRVNAAQFSRFCATIEAPCRSARASIVRLFEAATIEEVFETRELAFDSAAIASRMLQEVIRAGVDLRLSTEARVAGNHEHNVALTTSRGELRARHVINATYASLDAVGIPIRTTIKRELTEIALIEPPPELAKLAITVMDGPYFSTMPENPLPCRSNAALMQRDAARYLPSLAQARYRRSLYELKAVLGRSEANDSRPILIEQSPDNARVISVLGAKIDNIYDVLEFVRTHPWSS